MSAESLKKVLDGANAWIAFDLPRPSIVELSAVALAAGVKRLVVTTSLPISDINSTSIPEFDSAEAAFEEKGAAFTGIRHGDIVDGNEDNAYEIVNSTVPCLDSFVERGVLARVSAELLRVDVSANSQCGLSASGSFAAAYLNILRGSGNLTPRSLGQPTSTWHNCYPQALTDGKRWRRCSLEVFSELLGTYPQTLPRNDTLSTQIYPGMTQFQHNFTPEWHRMTVTEYEAQKKREEDKVAAIEKRKVRIDSDSLKKKVARV